ncbi:MAG: hypothetical protein ACRCTW_10585 [Lactococcus garvieae]
MNFTFVSEKENFPRDSNNVTEIVSSASDNKKKVTITYPEADSLGNVTKIYNLLLR